MEVDQLQVITQKNIFQLKIILHLRLRQETIETFHLKDHDRAASKDPLVVITGAIQLDQLEKIRLLIHVIRHQTD